MATTRKAPAKGMSKTEAKIERAEEKLAKKLPAPERKKFAALHKRETKVEKKEK